MPGLTPDSREARFEWALKTLFDPKAPFHKFMGAVQVLESYEQYYKNHPQLTNPHPELTNDKISEILAKVRTISADASERGRVRAARRCPNHIYKGLRSIPHPP
jgi:hypothetical protein